SRLAKTHAAASRQPKPRRGPTGVMGAACTQASERNTGDLSGRTWPYARATALLEPVRTASDESSQLGLVGQRGRADAPWQVMEVYGRHGCSQSIGGVSHVRPHVLVGNPAIEIHTVDVHARCGRRYNVVARDRSAPGPRARRANRSTWRSS